MINAARTARIFAEKWHAASPPGDFGGHRGEGWILLRPNLDEIARRRAERLDALVRQSATDSEALRSRPSIASEQTAPRFRVR